MGDNFSQVGDYSVYIAERLGFVEGFGIRVAGNRLKDDKPMAEIRTPTITYDCARWGENPSIGIHKVKQELYEYIQVEERKRGRIV